MYFKTVSANDSNIVSCKSKGFFDESIKPPTASNKILNPSLDYVGTNIYIIYEIDDYHPTTSYPTLENCLFGAVKVIKHADVDLCKHSGYDIGFDRKGSYLIGNEAGGNVIIFGVDMSLSSHTDNKKKAF